MPHITKRRRGEIVRSVFSALLDTPEGLTPDELFAVVENDLELTEFEQSEYPNRPGVRRFKPITRFSTITSVKAGWLLKGDANNSRWRVTPKGREAFQKFDSPQSFFEESARLYKEWKKSQATDAERDRNTADYGRWLFSHFCEEDDQRTGLLRLLADAMTMANTCGPRCWCVTSTRNRVRFNVRFMSVFTVYKKYVDISITADRLTPDEQQFFDQHGEKSEGTLASYPTVHWYSFPRTVFFDHLPLFSSVLAKMIDFAGTPRNTKTPWLKSHVPGIGRYITEELGVEGPVPTAAAVVETVARTEYPVGSSRSLPSPPTDLLTPLNSKSKRPMTKPLSSVEMESGG